MNNNPLFDLITREREDVWHEILQKNDFLDLPKDERVHNLKMKKKIVTFLSS